MSLTSYRAAPSRDGFVCATAPPVERVLCAATTRMRGMLISFLRELRILLGLAVTYSPTP